MASCPGRPRRVQLPAGQRHVRPRPPNEPHPPPLAALRDLSRSAGSYVRIEVSTGVSALSGARSGADRAAHRRGLDRVCPHVRFHHLDVAGVGASAVGPMGRDAGNVLVRQPHRGRSVLGQLILGGKRRGGRRRTGSWWGTTPAATALTFASAKLTGRGSWSSSLGEHATLRGALLRHPRHRFRSLVVRAGLARRKKGCGGRPTRACGIAPVGGRSATGSIQRCSDG